LAEGYGPVLATVLTDLLTTAHSSKNMLLDYLRENVQLRRDE
jgi:hypothetical protein